LLDYALFGIWVFYGLMVAGLITLRRTRPDLPRPYRMWGYPVTAIIFLLVTVWFLVNTLVTRPIPALAGTALILTGVPAYALWKRFGRAL
jgi:APA family basic amino acid/polyamine antiporter